MKKIIWAFLSLVLLFWSLEKLFDYLILQNKNIKASYVYSGGLTYDILYHGPCEPLFTISPNYLDSLTRLKSYNFALRHTDFADNYLHLYLYLKNNKAPKQVYLYVTPESFDLRFNTFHTFRFAPYLKDSVIRNVVMEMDSDYSKYTWIPFIKYAYYNSYKTFDALQGAKHIFTTNKKPYFSDGFIPHHATDYPGENDGYIAPKQLLYAANKKISKESDSSLFYELYSKKEEFVWDKTREKYLRKIISLCKENNIQLFLYESTPYFGSVYDQVNRKEFINRTHEIAFENRIQYLVFDTLPLTYEKKHFVCPLIFTVPGSKIFMKEFAKTVNKNYEGLRKSEN